MIIILIDCSIYFVLAPCTPTICLEFCLETGFGFLSDIFDDDDLVSVIIVDDDLANSGNGDCLDSKALNQLIAIHTITRILINCPKQNT